MLSMWALDLKKKLVNVLVSLTRLGCPCWNADHRGTVETVTYTQDPATGKLVETARQPDVSH